MVRVPFMRESHQDVYIGQRSQGKSSIAAATILLETDSAPSRFFVTRKPVRGSVMYSRVRFAGCSGVRMTDSPSTLQTKRMPGANPNLLRTNCGNTTCPLLESRVVTISEGWRRPTRCQVRPTYVSWRVNYLRHWQRFHPRTDLRGFSEPGDAQLVGAMQTSPRLRGIAEHRTKRNCHFGI